MAKETFKEFDYGDISQKKFKEEIAGLEAARARGSVGGRPKGFSKEARDKAMIAKTLYEQKEMSVSEIHQYLNISKSTLYRYLRVMGVKIGIPRKKW